MEIDNVQVVKPFGPLILIAQLPEGVIKPLNEIVDVILILQMSMECQSFNKTCFLITEWAEKVEHVISLRLHLIAQNFIVNKILQLYPAEVRLRDL